MTCIKGLFANPSTIVGAGSGLFTNKYLSKGDFLGFFSGDVMEDVALHSLETGRKKNSFQLTNNMSIVPTEKDALRLVNEPPPGCVANLVAVSIPLTHEGRVVARAIAYYVANEVKKNRELFVHYGDGYEMYRKDYRVGEKAAPPNRLQRWQEVLDRIPLQCFAPVENAAHSTRPPGRPPINKVWDEASGRYIDHGMIGRQPRRQTDRRPAGNIPINKSLDTSTGQDESRTPKTRNKTADVKGKDEHNEKSAKPRPRGRPPANKKWDGKHGRYI